MTPYLIQSDFNVLILAMEQRIAALTLLVASPIIQTSLSVYSDLQAQFQASVGTTAIAEYNGILAKLQALQPLAPTS
jgi:hypothetical protein